jgi:hypothetical protein
MSQWLAGHISDDELLEVVEDEGPPETAELRQALQNGAPRPELDQLVRETLQDVAAS